MDYSKEDFLNNTQTLAQNLLDFALSHDAISDAKIAIDARSAVKKIASDTIVTASSAGISHNVAVVLFSGAKRISFVQNGLNEQALHTAISDNAGLIHLAPENPNKVLLPADQVSATPAEDLDLFDAQGAPNEQLASSALTMAQTAMAQQDIVLAEGTASRSIAHSLIVASNGLKRYLPTTLYSTVAKAYAQNPSDPTEKEVEYDGSYVRYFSDADAPQIIGRASAYNARANLSSISPQAGKMPIILSHDAAEQFFSIVYSALDGGAVHSDETFMNDKLGQKIMSESVTMIDDPRIKRGLKSVDVDSAGLRCEPITFIDQGILKSFNINLEEARQLGIDPIGRENGRSNAIVQAGDKSPDELISDIDYGVYIKGFDGGIVDVNDGTHSRQAHGFVIKDGQITDQAVSGFGVAGSLQDMFMNVVLANDVPVMPSQRYDIAAPTTRINGATIAI